MTVCYNGRSSLDPGTPNNQIKFGGSGLVTQEQEEQMYAEYEKIKVYL